MFRLIVLFVILNICKGTFRPECEDIASEEDFEHCCGRSKRMDQIKFECKTIYPDTENSNFCFQECVLNRTGLLQNGEIQFSRALQIIGDLYKDENFASMAVIVLKKCVTVAKEEAPALRKMNRKRVGDCIAWPAIVGACLSFETFVNCPESSWKDTESCNRSRKYMKTCARKRQANNNDY